MGPVMANAVRRTNAVLKMVPDLKRPDKKHPPPLLSGGGGLGGCRFFFFFSGHPSFSKRALPAMWFEAAALAKNTLNTMLCCMCRRVSLWVGL